MTVNICLREFLMLDSKVVPNYKERGGVSD